MINISSHLGNKKGSPNKGRPPSFSHDACLPFTGNQLKKQNLLGSPFYCLAHAFLENKKTPPFVHSTDHPRKLCLSPLSYFTRNQLPLDLSVTTSVWCDEVIVPWLWTTGYEPKICWAERKPSGASNKGLASWRGIGYIAGRNCRKSLCACMMGDWT